MNPRSGSLSAPLEDGRAPERLARKIREAEKWSKQRDTAQENNFPGNSQCNLAVRGQKI